MINTQAQVGMASPPSASIPAGRGRSNASGLARPLPTRQPMRMRGSGRPSRCFGDTRVWNESHVFVPTPRAPSVGRGGSGGSFGARPSGEAVRVEKGRRLSREKPVGRSPNSVRLVRRGAGAEALARFKRDRHVSLVLDALSQDPAAPPADHGLTDGDSHELVVRVEPLRLTPAR
jgi:hypothetical protein